MPVIGASVRSCCARRRVPAISVLSWSWVASIVSHASASCSRRATGWSWPLPKAAPAAHGDALDRGAREELSIGKAINRAARDLPEGWGIRIDLERDAGVVFLIDPDGNETMSENGELFSDQINAAIDAAKGEPS